MSVRRLLLCATVLSWAVPAVAQTDEIIMRKPMRSMTGDPDGVTRGTAAWRSGAWTAPSTTCGVSVETRVVACVGAAGQASDGACPGVRPETSRTVPRYEGCTYSWLQGATSFPKGCGDVTGTRPVTCVRSDGQSADDASCSSAGAKPATQVQDVDYSTCTFAWSAGAWSAYGSTCSDTAARSRTVSCQRSDGTPAADARCSDVRPDVYESAAIYTGCAYAWHSAPGACVGQNRDFVVTCERSGSGYPARTVADTFCTGAKPASSRQDVSCGPPDLLLNSGFETGVSPWVGNSNLASSRVQDERHSGAYSLRLSGGMTAVTQEVSGMTPGRSYRLSVWFYGSSKVLLYVAQDRSVVKEATVSSSAGGWNQMTLDMTSIATSGTVYVGLGSSGGGYVDDVSFKQQ
jgi:hypothetical protein